MSLDKSLNSRFSSLFQGTKSNDDIGSQSETVNDLDEDDTTSERTFKNEEDDCESDADEKKNYERFDIAFSENGDCIMKSCNIDHDICDEFCENMEEDSVDSFFPLKPAPAIIELERYFQQPRR